MKMFNFKKFCILKLLGFFGLVPHIVLHYIYKTAQKSICQYKNVFFGKFLLYFYNWLVIKSQSMDIYTKNLPYHLLLLLLGEMSRLNILLKGTTAVIWRSRVHYSSCLLLLPRQLWQSDQKLALTTTALLPPQVWYELHWNIIFQMRSAHMRCFCQANQQAR